MDVMSVQFDTTASMKYITDVSVIVLLLERDLSSLYKNLMAYLTASKKSLLRSPLNLIAFNCNF